MNERQPYERLIAEKLKQLPVPDVEKSWQQMNRLLDNEPSPGSGGPGRGFRPGKAWWWTSLSAIVITTGLWIYTHTESSNRNAIASAKKEQVSNTSATAKAVAKNTAAGPAAMRSVAPDTPASPSQNSAIEQKSTLNQPANTSSNSSVLPGPASPGRPAAKMKTGFRASSAGSGVEPEARRPAPGTRSGSSGENEVAVVPDNHIPGTRYKSGAGNTNNAQPAENSGMTASRNTTGTVQPKIKSVAAAKSPGTRHRGKAVRDEGRGNIPDKDNPVTASAVNPNAPAPIGKGESRGKNGFVPGMVSLPHEPANTTLLPADSIGLANDGYRLLNSTARAAVKKSQREVLLAKKSKKERNGLQLGKYFQPFSFKNNDDDWWAVGLSLNSVLSVGDQVHLNYNINARPGTFSDYIPSPFVQYHVNNNVYLQTEINLSAPQNTPQLLVARGIHDQPGSPDRMEVSTYVRKLYYFNWPVSLHYSPFRNFYLAGGLQFSSLQSGIAMTQSRPISPSAPPGQVYNGEAYKFKDDSTAVKFSPNEWRWQTGADYYINRFTLGLRYNRAFKDVVNLQFPNTATVNRNSAFLLFLKYNLFESRKADKGSVPESLAGH